MPSQNTWQRSAGSIPLILDVVLDGVLVSGVVPTVQVVRYPDNFVADWAALDFVAPNTAVSGLATMSGIPFMPGLYRRDFDPSLFGEDSSSKQIYIAKYKAVIPSGYVESITQDSELVAHEMHVFVGLPDLIASFSE